MVMVMIMIITLFFPNTQHHTSSYLPLANKVACVIYDIFKQTAPNLI
jgi:hypothetical protein